MSGAGLGADAPEEQVGDPVSPAGSNPAVPQRLPEVGPEGHAGERLHVDPIPQSTAGDVGVDLHLQGLEPAPQAGTQGRAERGVGVREHRSNRTSPQLLLDELSDLVEHPPQLVLDRKVRGWERCVDEEFEGGGEQGRSIPEAAIDRRPGHSGSGRHRVDVDGLGPVLTQQEQRRTRDALVDGRVAGSAGRSWHMRSSREQKPGQYRYRECSDILSLLPEMEILMTPNDVLVPGALAILFVVAWFVFGLIDATRPDRPKGRTGTRTRAPGTTRSETSR